MIVYDKIEQNTPEWFEIRRGKITGSVIKNLISPKELNISKSKTAKSALLKIVASKYTESGADDAFTTGYMIRGIEGEGRARALYQSNILDTVTEVGFIESDCQSYGMSPDGIVGDEGFIEIKCLNQDKHLSSIFDNAQSILIDEGFKLQILLGFVVNPKFKWCDLILYNEDFREINHKILVYRIERNDKEVEIVKNNLNILSEMVKLLSEMVKPNNTNENTTSIENKTISIAKKELEKILK